MANAQVTIRQGQPADSAVIADLINRAFEIESLHIVQSPETASSVADEMQKGIYFVAVDSKGRLVGCANVKTELRGIFKLAVESDLRRQGIGCQLMAAAERYAKDEGWNEVKIGILNFRLELFDIYQKLGYTNTGEPAEPVTLPRQPYHLVKMSKKLP